MANPRGRCGVQQPKGCWCLPRCLPSFQATHPLQQPKGRCSMFSAEYRYCRAASSNWHWKSFLDLWMDQAYQAARQSKKHNIQYYYSQECLPDPEQQWSSRRPLNPASCLSGSKETREQTSRAQPQKCPNAELHKESAEMPFTTLPQTQK